APTSLKIEYQDAVTSGNWNSVNATGGNTASGQSQGQVTFRPMVSSRSINLRAEIADAGGNVAYFSQRMSLVPVRPAPSSGAAFAPPADPSATPWPSDARASSARPNQWIASETTGAVAPIRSSRNEGSEQVRIPSVVQNPYSTPAKMASSPSGANPVAEEVLPPPQPMTSRSEVYPGNGFEMSSPPPSDSAADHRAFAPSVPTAQDYQSSVQPPAESQDEYGPLLRHDSQYGTTSDVPSDAPAASDFNVAPEVMPSPEPTQPSAGETVEAPYGQRPRLTNSRRFSLDYDVESVGPEGVAAVELWGTTDGGRTWGKWGVDPDRASPFDVEVNNEATYGFKIVIVGRNGLATSSPQPGDAADIWVNIDGTRPAARLTGASYGQSQTAGKLDIRWEAADANLGPRPITLAIGDRPDGPFAPIAAGLPNTGQYFWEYDPRSPRQMYLRLEVRDEAGNVSIDQLTEPIKVEGLEPKGRIRGFNPGPETTREAFRSPLFQ
ncbi:MAG TPA: hypothetical protein VFV87_13005, partial [Pirellulaceae bacterium]|nr:hypothetical protein [Pirellulaceae bacterium]